MFGGFVQVFGNKRGRIVFFAQVIGYGVFVEVAEDGQNEFLDGRAFAGIDARLQLGGLQILHGAIAQPGFDIVFPCTFIIRVEWAIFQQLFFGQKRVPDLLYRRFVEGLGCCP